MPDKSNPPTAEVLRFGPFVLRPIARRLEKDGVQVNIGGRALDILTLLAERAGEIIGHQELLARVWQNINVDPSSLRVQMAALRKALGEGDDSGHYVVNIAGRGYCFVAPVERELIYRERGETGAKAALPELMPIVGRDQAIRTVIARLVDSRLVTIAGPGGVGKTAVALAVAHSLVPAFSGAIRFLDLGAVSSPQAALATIGRMALGFNVQLPGSPDWIFNHLRGRRMLIVLDCIDFLVASMAEFIVALIRETVGIHILLTSRQPLGVNAEEVVRLPPLAYPDDSASVGVATLGDYSAVQMLVSLVNRAGSDFHLNDGDLRALARIAAKLDGLPLALELAAANILQNGIAQTESLVASRFALFMTGPNTVSTRHESLNATLEWSYQQLTPEHRIVFRNLSVFTGPFTLEGVQHVSIDFEMNATEAAAAAMALMERSLIYQDGDIESKHFRMLDTTRAFGLAKLLTFGEGEVVRRRHATYVEQYLVKARAGAPGLVNGIASRGLSANIHNIRAALEWCFGPGGETLLGARIAAVSLQAFEALWLYEEGLNWLTLALSALDKESIGTRLDLDLRMGIVSCALASPVLAHHAFVQLPLIVELADKCGTDVLRAEARAWECMFMAQARHIDVTVNRAESIRAIAQTASDYPSLLLGDWVLGFAYHLRGDLYSVARLCKSAATLAISGSMTNFSDNINVSHCHQLAQVCALGSYARTLWLQGQVDTALEAAWAALGNRGARQLRQLNVLIFFMPLFIWAGAWEDAESLLAENISGQHPESIRVPKSYCSGAILLRRGDISAAIPPLEDAFTHFPAFTDPGAVALDLAEALALSGRFDPARQAMARAFAGAERLGETFFYPELYRVMGVVTAIAPAPETPNAEEWFLRAIECASRQGSLSLELRAATSLARYYTATGRSAQGHAILQSVYDRFTEGFTTPDLVAARQLLAELSDAPHPLAKSAAQG